MAVDVIIYYPNKKDFYKELKKDFKHKINDKDIDNPQFIADLAPGTKQNKNDKEESMDYMRATDEDLAILNSMESVQVLGSYEEVFADPLKTEIYDRCYDQTPIEIDDGNGGTTIITPPRKFVVIA